MGIKRKPTAACRAIARAPLSPLRPPPPGLHCRVYLYTRRHTYTTPIWPHNARHGARAGLLRQAACVCACGTLIFSLGLLPMI